MGVKVTFGSIRTILLISVPSCVGILVIFWNISGLGLSVWDEFYYTSTAKWLLRTGGFFAFYEPPGFPVILALFFRMLGQRDYVAIAATGTFAVLTVFLVALVGSRWFGLKTGLIASSLLLLCPLFLIFGRVAMTDMPFTFFFAATVVLSYTALMSRKLRDAIPAALAFAFCNMIKYNAFMALIIPLLFSLVLVKTDTRLTATIMHCLKTIVVIATPSIIEGLLFLISLGAPAGTRAHLLGRLFQLASLNTLSKGISRFEIVLAAHQAQLNFIPLISAPFYVGILVGWVPLSILAFALIAFAKLRGRKTKPDPFTYLIIWLVGFFFVISSIPQAFERSILPLLPPLSLMAAIGLQVLVESISRFMPKMTTRVKVRRMIVPVLLLLLILATSVPAAVHAVEINHVAYRWTGVFLSTTGDTRILATANPVIDFYYPVQFEPINATTICNAHYIVVDGKAVVDGYEPLIEMMQREDRIRLIWSMHNDIPAIFYLGVLGVTNPVGASSQVRVYRVTNSTTCTTS